MARQADVVGPWDLCRHDPVVQRVAIRLAVDPRNRVSVKRPAATPMIPARRIAKNVDGFADPL
jgi:hypothetical protein